MSAIAEKPRKKRVSAFSHRKVDPAYYWMTVPAMILFMVFLYWPFLRGVMYSFTNSKGYGKYKWIGLTNYKAMFQDERIGRAYLFTFFIAIVVTILVNLLSMFIAVLLNSKIAFRNGFRAIYFIPHPQRSEVIYLHIFVGNRPAAICAATSVLPVYRLTGFLIDCHSVSLPSVAKASNQQQAGQSGCCKPRPG